MMSHKFRHFYCLLLFVLAIGVPTARADTSWSIPVNPQTVDMVSWVTQAVDSMVSSDGGLFVAIAAKWLTNFAFWPWYSSAFAWHTAPSVIGILRWTGRHLGNLFLRF